MTARRILALLAPLAALVLAAAASAAQETARERWNALAPEERAVLLDRFARLRGMSEIERAALQDRAGRLADLKPRLAEALPPAVRKSLKELPPEERRAVIRDHALLEARELARRVREALPPDALRGLDELGPGERAAALAQLRAKIRAEGGVAAIEHLGQRLGLPRSEIERLQGQALEARLDTLLSLERTLLRRAIEHGGLPPGIARATWDELEALSDRDFFARWRELRPLPKGALGAAAPLDRAGPAHAAGSGRFRAIPRPAAGRATARGRGARARALPRAHRAAPPARRAGAGRAAREARVRVRRGGAGCGPRASAAPTPGGTAGRWIGGGTAGRWIGGGTAGRWIGGGTVGRWIGGGTAGRWIGGGTAGRLGAIARPRGRGRR